MGCLFAGYLTRSGHEVTLLDRSSRRAAEISKSGLGIETQGETFHVPCSATSDPTCLGDTELAIVCVKAYDTVEVAYTLGGHLGKSASVLTLQNGLGNVEALTDHIDPDRVFGGSTAEGATVLGVGSVRHAGRGPTVVAPVVSERLDAAERLASVLTDAGFDAIAKPDLDRVLWGKLLINAVINPMTALLGVQNGQLVEIPSARDLLENVTREVTRIAVAENAIADGADTVAMVENVCRATALNRSSMLQDITARRRTEVDAIFGKILACAEMHGIEMPVTRTLYGAVKVLESCGDPTWRDGLQGEQQES
jgi:2-dehydropantoate 2-reductase